MDLEIKEPEICPHCGNEIKDSKDQSFAELKQKPFLSIAETCKLIGISRRTVYRMLERGELVAGKAGKRTIVRRADVDKLFEPKNLSYRQPSPRLAPPPPPAKRKTPASGIKTDPSQAKDGTAEGDMQEAITNQLNLF
ncbi:MAG: helix-turn-helix domain-containing protein [Cytophagaceae bacterium]